jgi:transglutaminase-like putative cysteine protease
MLLEIVHTTGYAYDQPVFLEPHTLRLRPRCDWNQRLVRFDLSADPAPDGCSENIDLDGNSTASLWFSGLHDSLNIEARSVVETLCDNPLNYLLNPAFREMPVHYHGEAGVLLESYCLPTTQDESIDGLAHSTSQEVGGEIPAFLSTLNQHIYKLCEKETRLEGDPFSGLASRFVSGYNRNGGDQEEHDLHAWAEVYLDGAGWRGYDPSLGVLVADRHVAVAAGRVPVQTQPVKGSYRGAVSSKMKVDIQIEACQVAARE